MIEEIRKLKAAGRSWQTIADATGLTEGQVRGLWQRHRNDPVTEDAFVGSHPKGWEPGFELNGRAGIISLPPSATPQPDFDAYLRELGFDPDEFEIIEPFQVRCWDALRGMGKGNPNQVVRLWYYKANIVRRRSGEARVNVAELVEFVRSRPEPEPHQTQPDGEAFVYVISDAQLGKSDGDGVKGTVARMKRAIDDGLDRLSELADSGRRIEQVHVVSLADLIEGTAGHYAMQTFNVELNRREQVKLATELLWETVDRFAHWAPDLHVSGVAGNHGENRINGKAYTSFGDSDDLAILDQLRMVAELTQRSNITFHIPADELEIVVDACGTKLGIAHGHQMRKGVEPWWKDQMMGRNPIGEADILITGHRHHLDVKEVLGRYAFQAPALECRSDWFLHTNGAPGRPGVLTFTTAKGKWRDLQVL